MQNNIDVAENVDGMQMQIPMRTDLVELKERSLLKKEDIYLGFKRTSDVVISAIALVVLSPVMLFTAVGIKLSSKGSVFYKHKRIGKNGKYIYLYKFRSMYADSNERLEKMLENPEVKEEWENNFKLKNDPRITKIGKFLRKTSLDELPQLINIIKGDMSIIGPRPVIDGEIEKYGANKERFLSVTPGLTGNWAANGRSCTTYEERMELELAYINNMSLKMDIDIFFKTIISVFQRKGAM